MKFTDAELSMLLVKSHYHSHIILEKFVSLGMWNKIYTWYDNIENTNVKVIIGGLSMMLFARLMFYLVDNLDAILGYLFK